MLLANLNYCKRRIAAIKVSLATRPSCLITFGAAARGRIHIPLTFTAINRPV